MYSSSDETSSDSEVEELVFKIKDKLKDRLKTLSEKVKRNNEISCPRKETRKSTRNKNTNSAKTNNVNISSTVTTDLADSVSSAVDQKSITRNNESFSKSEAEVNFVIDKNFNQIDGDSDSESDQHTKDDLNVKKSNVQTSKNKTKDMLSSSIQTSLSIDGSTYVEFGHKKKTKDLKKLARNTDAQVMKKSVLVPDIEKQSVLPPYAESVRTLKKTRRLERQKTKGKGWFDMRAPEMTEADKNDLTVLQMRRALDPKRFYKNNDIKTLPKFFKFGTVIEGAADFYHARVPKKQRKSTMVEELLADAEFRKYNKRKYVEIQEAKRKGAGAYKHMKRLKKKR